MVVGADGSGDCRRGKRKFWPSPTKLVVAVGLGLLFLVQELSVADQIGVGRLRGLWLLLYDGLVGVALLVGYRFGRAVPRWFRPPSGLLRWPPWVAHLFMGALGAGAIGAFAVFATTSSTVNRWPFDPCPAGSPLYPTTMGCASGTGGWAVLAAGVAVMVGGYGLAATARTVGRAWLVLSPVVPAAAALAGALLMVLSGVRLAPGDRSVSLPTGGRSLIEPDPLVVARASDIRGGTVLLMPGLTMLAIAADILHRRSAGVSKLRMAVIAFSTLSAGLLLCVLWIGVAASPAD
ncbi:MAG: hypothetical protein ACKV2O_17625 [Acidimicrobiales bacterium]